MGQAVIARHGAVLALESASGTAAMVSALESPTETLASGVLVKVSKPGQELRADMPTIGPDTIAQISKAGLAGIAVEAGKTIILDKPETLKAANRTGVFVIGMTVGEKQS